MALTLRGNGQVSSDNYGIDSDGSITATGITSTGNVGIGTSTPNSYSNQTTLTINGATYGRLDLEQSGSLKASLFATTGSATLYTPTDILSFDTSGGEAMRINGSGAVTTPNQPAFWVRLNGDQTGYNPGYYNHSVIFNYKEFDVGNDVDTTTGLFTAPVNGVYIFFASAYSQTNNFNQAWFTVNGGRAGGSDFVKGAADSFVNCSVTFKLSANDTVGYHPYGSGSNLTIKANPNHTWFRGSLIG